MKSIVRWDNVVRVTRMWTSLKVTENVVWWWAIFKCERVLGNSRCISRMQALVCSLDQYNSSIRAVFPIISVTSWNSKVNKLRTCKCLFAVSILLLAAWPIKWNPHGSSKEILLAMLVLHMVKIIKRTRICDGIKFKIKGLIPQLY